MTGETRLRKCQGCGHPFRGRRDEPYCSALCARGPAAEQLLALLAGFPVLRSL